MSPKVLFYRKFSFVIITCTFAFWDIFFIMSVKTQNYIKHVVYCMELQVPLLWLDISTFNKVEQRLYDHMIIFFFFLKLGRNHHISCCFYISNELCSRGSEQTLHCHRNVSFEVMKTMYILKIFSFWVHIDWRALYTCAHLRAHV